MKHRLPAAVSNYDYIAMLPSWSLQSLYDIIILLYNTCASSFNKHASIVILDILYLYERWHEWPPVISSLLSYILWFSVLTQFPCNHLLQRLLLFQVGHAVSTLIDRATSQEVGVEALKCHTTVRLECVKERLAPASQENDKKSEI